MDEAFIRDATTSDTDESVYPFSIPAIKAIDSIVFSPSVTFFVGENGSGKSTLTESIAVAAGFNAEGGTKNYHFITQNTTSSLTDKITLVRGYRREKYGYFLRAESFYTTANYAESGTFGRFGPIPILFDGKHIHEQSHGEAFLSIVREFSPGLFIFDEPESALSPQRQLALLIAIKDLVEQGSQFIIATHSPILLSYPGAKIYQLSQNGIEQVAYEDVEHVKLTKDFLNNPGDYLDKLLRD
jgi:predicted ATPase